jgi:hypothetical protein
MTLDKSKLKSALKAIATDFERSPDDNGSVWFELSMTSANAAKLWADAMEAYAAGVTQGGSGASTGHDALETALAAAFGTTAAAVAMDDAFSAFAVVVASGMADTAPVSFSATPPPGKVGFPALFVAPAASADSAGTAVSDAIHTWMKTGQATPNTPPGAGASGWS